MTERQHPSETEGLDVVLPLIEADLQRAERILFPSMRRYLGAMVACWIVVPDDDFPAVSARLTDPWMTVISECEVVPEARWFRRPAVDGRAAGLSGWHLQQLIKLSAARFVATPFYLTIDADMLCCRPIAASDLLPDGRAIAVVDRDRDGVRRRWYERAADVLGANRPRLAFSETPAVLGRDAVQSLFAHLEQRLHPNALRAEALLLSHLPWTATSLYYTYLDDAGLFGRYHVERRAKLTHNNVWTAGDLASWDPAATFDPAGAHFFTVLQSQAVDDLDAVVRELRDTFQIAGEASPF